MTQKELAKTIGTLLEDKSITTKDIPLCKFILGLLTHGNDFEKVVKWAKIDKKKAKEWHENLDASGYFSGKKIVFEDDALEHSSVTFFLMMAVAQGYIERTISEK